MTKYYEWFDANKATPDPDKRVHIAAIGDNTCDTITTISLEDGSTGYLYEGMEAVPCERCGKTSIEKVTMKMKFDNHWIITSHPAVWRYCDLDEG